MAAGKVNWNAADYDENAGPRVLPKGEYLLLVKDSMEKPTKTKQGSYFEFDFRVVKPTDFSNHKLTDRFNVHNPSETAQRIGREQFNALCIAAGFQKGGVKTTSQLHGKYVVAYVEVIPRNDDPDKETNEISGYRAVDKNSKAAKTPEPAEPAEPPEEESGEAGGGIDDDDIPF